MRLCEIEGCEAKHYGLGMCCKHYSRHYRERHREVGIDVDKAYRESDLGRATARKGHLRHSYNISPEEYEMLLAAQGGVCAICKQPPNGVPLDTDHDRSCCPGRKSCGSCLRGLLCRWCNSALMSAIDSPHIQAGLDYAADPPAAQLKRLAA